MRSRPVAAMHLAAHLPVRQPAGASHRQPADPAGTSHRQAAGSDRSLANLVALQRVAGNQVVCRMLEASGQGARAAGPATATYTATVRVQRAGPWETDFGPQPDPTLTDRKLSQLERLRVIDRWLVTNRSELAWLGLFEDGQVAPPGTLQSDLAQGVEWASNHMSMWLDTHEAVGDDDIAQLNWVYTNAHLWLQQHRADRFAKVDEVITKARENELTWFADVLSQRRQEIQDIVARGTPGDGYLKAANLKMRTLSRIVESCTGLLDSTINDLRRQESLRLDINDALDAIDDMTADVRLKDRKTFLGEAVLLRELWQKLEFHPERKPTVRKKNAQASEKKSAASQVAEIPKDFVPRVSARNENVNLLELVSKDVTRTASALEELSKSAEDLGCRVEHNYGFLPVQQVKPTAKNKPEIIVKSNMSPTIVAGMLPIAIGNALRVAGAIINSPFDGQTGFKVRGQGVFHTSAGSLSAGSSKGTAFWINSAGDRVLVAMGKHTGGQGDQYRITWRANGVSGSMVTLNSTKASEMLKG